jgi:AcrR family transcriptional regulator
MVRLVVDRRVTRTREAVLLTAREVLLSDGWEHVTLARVAERSGYGRATLYRHWPNRLDLLKDVIREEARLTHATARGEVRADLLAELEAFRTAITSSGLGHIVIAIAHQARTDPDFADLNRAIRAEGVRVLEEILRAAREQGAVDDDIDLQLAVGQLAGPILYRFLFEDEPLEHSHVVAVVDRFLAAYRRP